MIISKSCILTSRQSCKQFSWVLNQDVNQNIQLSITLHRKNHPTDFHHSRAVEVLQLVDNDLPFEMRFRYSRFKVIHLDLDIFLTRIRSIWTWNSRIDDGSGKTNLSFFHIMTNHIPGGSFSLIGFHHSNLWSDALFLIWHLILHFRCFSLNCFWKSEIKCSIHHLQLLAYQKWHLLQMISIFFRSLRKKLQMYCSLVACKRVIKNWNFQVTWLVIALETLDTMFLNTLAAVECWELCSD